MLAWRLPNPTPVPRLREILTKLSIRWSNLADQRRMPFYGLSMNCLNPFRSLAGQNSPHAMLVTLAWCGDCAMVIPEVQARPGVRRSWAQLITSACKAWIGITNPSWRSVSMWALVSIEAVSPKTVAIATQEVADGTRALAAPSHLKHREDVCRNRRRPVRVSLAPR